MHITSAEGCRLLAEYLATDYEQPTSVISAGCTGLLDRIVVYDSTHNLDYILNSSEMQMPGPGLFIPDNAIKDIKDGFVAAVWVLLNEHLAKICLRVLNGKIRHINVYGNQSGPHHPPRLRGQSGVRVPIDYWKITNIKGVYEIVKGERMYVRKRSQPDDAY